MLEPSMGSLPFAALIAELMLTSSLFYILTAAAVASRARPQGLLGVLGLVSGGRLWQSCAVGFSGVLFGLKVVLNSGSPGWSQIAGVRVPTKYAAWAELVLVQLISPNVSFVGHLCGIAAGLVHVHVTRRLLRWRWGAWGAGSGGRGGGRGRTYGRGTWGG